MTDKKIFTFDDLKEKEKEEGNYSGGRESGISVKNKDVVSNIIKKAGEKQELNDSVTIKTLTLWKDGFCIDNNDLLSYDLPENKLFLEKIEQGIFDFPGINIGEDVNLRIIKKTDQFFKKEINTFYSEKKKIKQEYTNQSKKLCFINNIDKKVCSEKPKTKILLKLPDGSKKVFCFNTNETTKDLIDFVSLILGTKEIVLFYGINQKFLEPTNRTIEELELCNCVLFIQNKKGG